MSLVEAYLINPNSWKIFSLHLKHTGDVRPTSGQAIFLLFIIVLNGIFSALRLYTNGSEWKWDAPGATLAVSFADRLGALSTANIPLLILFGARNNPLLFMTGKIHLSPLNSR
jgi:hypothetical protein